MILRRTTAGSHFAPGSKILTERLTHRGIHDAEDNACDSRLPSPQGGLRCRDCGHCHRGAGAHASASGAARRAKTLFPGLADYEGLFRNTGIETRYMCQPAEWYEREHGWEERSEVFVHHALDLLEEVTLGAVRAAGIELKDIGAIVVNTITGLAIPSLDSKLMNRLDLPASVERLPVFGLGCGGGVAGLARSGRYAQAMQSGRAHV